MVVTPTGVRRRGLRRVFRRRPRHHAPVLPLLGIVLHEALTRLNALKQILALAVNTAAALLFVTSDKVYWGVAAVMAISSMLGGGVGGRLAGSIRPARLRVIVVAVGFVVSIAYAIKIWF
jgi:uncharacterized protein